MFIKNLYLFAVTSVIGAQAVPLDVAGGNHHTFILRQDGVVLSMGQDLHAPEKGGASYLGGKLGREIEAIVLPGADSESLVAQANYNPGRGKVRGLDGVEVVSIASGQNDGAAITVDGRLFMWGPNNRGQLGLGDRRQRRQASQVAIPGRVAEIAIGSAHTLVVTDEGRVFSMGIGKTGVLGHGDFESHNHPKLIEALAGEVVTQVAAGQNTHSLFLTKSGHVYSCGSNKQGQLGRSNSKLNLPVKVEGETLFQFVAVGVHTSFAIDRKGRLWGWGSGAKAHFPRPKLDRLEKATLFKRAPLNLIAAAAGSRHTVVLNQKGEVFTWGLHTMISGQLGIGSLTKSATYLTPQKVKVPGKVLRIDAMANNTYVTTADKVYGWGPTSHGRLGMKADGAHQVQDAKGQTFNIAHSPVEILQTPNPPKE